MTAFAAGGFARRLPYLLPLTLFLMLAIYFWIGLGKDPHEVPSVLIDQEVAPFALAPLQGRERGFSSDDLRGQVSLVNVFGSWCAACQIEHPFLMRLKRERSGAGLRHRLARKGSAGRAGVARPSRRSLHARRRRPGQPGGDRLRRHRRAGNLHRRCRGRDPLQTCGPDHARGVGTDVMADRPPAADG